VRPLTRCPPAALYGHVEALGALLDLGAHVNAADKTGRTALHCAALHGHSEVARLLLASGAEVDARTKGNITPLALAAQGCHVEVAHVLLEGGANAFLAVASPPLLSACRQGDTDTCRLLLSKGLPAEAGYPPAGRTPLHEASAGECARLLLAAGASATACDSNGRTPLHGRSSGDTSAIALHAAEVVAVLVESGADVHAADAEGNTPLHSAGTLSSSANQSCLAAVEALLRAGADSNAANKRGRTPLHLVLDAEAFEYGRHNFMAADTLLRVAKALVHAGASLEAKDSSGLRPMHSTRQADLLRANAALVTRRGGGALSSSGSAGDLASTVATATASAPADGWTPLHAAAALGDSDEVTRLVTQYVSGSAVDSVAGSLADAAARVARALSAPDVFGTAAAGESALRCAAQAGHLACVTALLRAPGAGAALRDDVDGGGVTPLHAAAAAGHRDVCATLLAAGCDVNAMDALKRTPLLMACCFGHFALARELVTQHNALVNVNYGHGATLLYGVASAAASVSAAVDAVEGDDDVSLCSLLLAKGANHLTATYTGPPSHGRGALAAAAKSGRLALARLLIERGADVKDIDWSGAVPLDGCASPDMRRLLRSFDADVQRVLEQRAASEAAAAAAAAAEQQRQRLAAQQAEIERHMQEEAAAKAAVAAAAAAAAAADTQRRKVDEEQRRSRLEAEAKRRAEKAEEEAMRAAAEEMAWRERSAVAVAAEEARRAAEAEEAAILAAMSCPACVARMRRDQVQRRQERHRGGGGFVGLLKTLATVAVGAAAGAAAAVYVVEVGDAVRRVGDARGLKPVRLGAKAEAQKATVGQANVRAA
jgi:ankyrin repeat protein